MAHKSHGLIKNVMNLYYSLKENTIEEINLESEEILTNLNAQLFRDNLKLNTSLKRIYFKKINFGKEVLNAIWDILIVHPTLEVLTISWNSLEEDSLKSLAEVVRLNKKIKHLNIEGIICKDLGIEILVPSLLENKTLQSLNLKCNSTKKRLQNLNSNYFQLVNEITKNGIAHLCQVIETNETLNSLYLDENLINDEGIFLLCNSLKNNLFISTLTLSGNSITDLGGRSLSELLDYNCIIQTLDLKENEISPNLMQEINSKIWENNKAISPPILNSPFPTSTYAKMKILKMPNCDITEIPFELSQFTDLLVIDLSNNKLTHIPNIEKLAKLKLLNLAKNRIDASFCFSWRFPHSLEKFYIQENEGMSEISYSNIANSFSLLCNKDELDNDTHETARLLLSLGIMNQILVLDVIEKAKALIQTGTFPGIEQFRACTFLTLNEYKLNHFPSVLVHLPNLKKLDLRNCNIQSVPLDIKMLTNLQELWLEGNQIDTFPTALKQVTRLQRLWLDRNKISEINNCVIVNIQSFSICNNKLVHLGSIVDWNLLQILFLNGNEIEVISPDIKNLKQLKQLHLNNNKLKALPEEIGDLNNLIDLQVKDNQLVELPVRIGELVRLKKLIFCGNQISKLPPSMAFLKLDVFEYKKNPLVFPPIDVIQDWNSAKGYLEDLLVGQQNCNYVKMIIVGEENVGKTSLVKSLKAYCASNIKLTQKRGITKAFEAESISTDGIDISLQACEVKVDPQYKLPNNKLIFNIWDFGGQRVYYSTHPFFLSEGALYLVVWNMLKYKYSELERVIYWIKTIQSLVPKAQILLVGTHEDKLIESGFDVNVLKKDMSEKTGIPLSEVIALSCKSRKKIEKLVNMLVKKALTFPMIGHPFPKMYSSLKMKLDEITPKRVPPILSFAELKNIAKENNIVGEEQLERATTFFHTLGFCLHFAKEKELRDYIVLNPQWLANIIATLISTKSVFIQKNKGVLDHFHLPSIWKGYPKETHALLLKFMEKFNVAIPITDTSDIYQAKSVVPALLSEEESPEFLHSWNQEEVQVKRYYVFDLLPVDLFPRLIASIILIIGKKGLKFWRNGLLIFKDSGRALITINSINQAIVIAYAGRNWFPLFKKIKFTLEMLLKKWDELQVKIFVNCSTCCKSNQELRDDNSRMSRLSISNLARTTLKSLSQHRKSAFSPNIKISQFSDQSTDTVSSNESESASSNYCFEWKKCYQAYSEGQEQIYCEKSKSLCNLSEMVPELFKSDIRSTNLGEITLLEKIGEGSYGCVYKGEFEGKQVAVKQLKLEEFYDSNDQELRDFLQELEFMTNENHPNLVQLLAMVISPPWLVLELASHGSLFEVLYESEINFDWNLALRTMYDVSVGMNYLHSLTPPILHCDLRSPNILIFSLNPSDYVVAKVADFGLAQYSLGSILVKGKKGFNPNWSAPELLKGLGMNKFCDVYSYGMVMYEILTGNIPFDRKFNDSWNFKVYVEDQVCEGIRPPYDIEEIHKRFKKLISRKIFNMMVSCWNQDSLRRPTFQVILSTLKILIQDYIPEIKETTQASSNMHFDINLSSNNLKNETPKSNNVIPTGWNLVHFRSTSQFIKEHALETNQENKTNTFLCSVADWKGTYMIKEIPLESQLDQQRVMEEDFLAQVKLWNLLNSKGCHPNLVKLLGYYHDLSLVVLVMEYMEGGNLSSIIWRKSLSKEFFSNNEIINLGTQLLKGLQYLHQNSIAHKDLNTSNILVKLDDISSIHSVYLNNYFRMDTQAKKKELEEKWRNFKKISENEMLNWFAIDIFCFSQVLLHLMLLKSDQRNFYLPENLTKELSLSSEQLVIFSWSSLVPAQYCDFQSVFEECCAYFLANVSSPVQMKEEPQSPSFYESLIKKIENFKKD